jgi:Ribbon-helix-helix protein, copG family
MPCGGRPRHRHPTCYPTLMAMRKTSVYLDERLALRLATLARAEGRSQAEILREAVETYEPRGQQDRNFALTGAGRGDGSSIADVADEDLLAGFGE